MTDRKIEVEWRAYQQQGNSKLWTFWNNRLIWADFKMRWYARFFKLRAWWRNLRPDPVNQYNKYTHPTS